MRKRDLKISENILDKAINAINPELGVKRRRAKMQLAVSNSFVGADSEKRHMKQYSPSSKSADAEVMQDRKKLVDRSRDLYKNSPIAGGAIRTKVSNIVGTGLKLQPCINAKFLGMSEEQASEWENLVRFEFETWAKSKDCDITRTNNFYELQALAERSELIDGDTICLLPMKPVASLSYSLRIQLIDSDRLCNEKNAADTTDMVGGIKLDEFGAPISYCISSHHPGDSLNRSKMTWRTIPAFGSVTGRRNVIHLFDRERIGQSRGLPDLAPVIECLKQLTDYTEYELEAASISAMFAVFVKTENGEGIEPKDPDTGQTYSSSNPSEIKLSGGLMVDLEPGESIETASPNRPNMNFDPFVLAILRQVGMALELPYEILIKHFTASYSAARAAMLEAWRYFSARREWMALNFCHPIYEAWMWEAVALGRIDAPGFLVDPAIRAAYLNAQWTGPSRGQIDELKEAKAAQVWLDLGVKTLEQVTREETGQDWESNHRQRVKEVMARREAGLEIDPTIIAAPSDETQKGDEADDNEGENKPKD